MKFSAVISHPIQHFSPIFTELAKMPGVDVRIFYLCDHGVKDSFDDGFGTAFSWDVPLTDGHDHVFLKPDFRPKTFGFFEMDSPELIHELNTFKPDLLWIHGYAQRMCWRAAKWARKHPTLSLYFGDSELLHERSWLRKTAKKRILPTFFRTCDRILTIGDNNEAYYRHYGVSENKMVRVACPIDVSRFTLTEQQHLASRQDIRAKFGIPDDHTTVLFSGKLQDYKRPLDLVHAVAKSGRTDLHVLFIGSGAESDKLLALAKTLNISKQIHISGFINQSEIPQYLSAGDMLAVTSSRDAHPLSVSEILPMGLPIVISDKVGCVGPTDTARPEQNAIVYPCGDIDALSYAINRLSDKALYEKFASVSRRIAPTQDIATTANTVFEIGKQHTATIR